MGNGDYSFCLLFYVTYLWMESESRPNVLIDIPNSFSNTSTTNQGTLENTLVAHVKS
jgi:hypothetical protein